MYAKSDSLAALRPPLRAFRCSGLRVLLGTLYAAPMTGRTVPGAPEPLPFFSHLPRKTGQRMIAIRLFPRSQNASYLPLVANNVLRRRDENLRHRKPNPALKCVEDWPVGKPEALVQPDGVEDDQWVVSHRQIAHLMWVLGRVFAEVRISAEFGLHGFLIFGPD